MPNYEFKCKKCDKVITKYVMVADRDTALVQCDADGCDGECKRIFAGCKEFFLHGSGFTITNRFGSKDMD